MTIDARVLDRHAPASDAAWVAREHRFELRGATHRLRLLRRPDGWTASVDTVEGPTIGTDRSPYLAVSRALEPIGGQLIDAMLLVADLRLAPRAALPGAEPQP
jgi:hypothetical protein